MTLVFKTPRVQIWAQFDPTAQVYELFYDNEGETYTGWCVDSLADARAAAKYIVEEHLA